jgi:hypothetical protein
VYLTPHVAVNPDQITRVNWDQHKVEIHLASGAPLTVALGQLTSAGKLALGLRSQDAYPEAPVSNKEMTAPPK